MLSTLSLLSNAFHPPRPASSATDLTLPHLSLALPLPAASSSSALPLVVDLPGLGSSIDPPAVQFWNIVVGDETLDAS